jgi:hypothetical protein
METSQPIRHATAPGQSSVLESTWLEWAESERAQRAADREADASDYRPELATADLIVEVRRLLTIERRAERLICRYLADMADRVRGRSDRELEPFIDEFDAAQAIFGLGTRETRERIRIGRALRQLPDIEHAFIAGDVSYSRVRELTRVAQPDTESNWLELARSLDMRALERRVASATREAAAARVTGDGTREAGAARATGEGIAGGGAGEPAGGAGECNAWTGDAMGWSGEEDAGASAVAMGWSSEEDGAARGDADGWSGEEDGGANGVANRSLIDWTNDASATRAPSRRADDANSPASRRRVRACTEWTGRDSVRVTFDLSAEAWAIVKHALECARRRAAATPVGGGEALEDDPHEEPAAHSEGTAHVGVAPLDDGEALEALARAALSAQNASDCDPRRTEGVDENDRRGASDPDTGIGLLARLPASATTLPSGSPEVHSARAATASSGSPEVHSARAATASSGSPEVHSARAATASSGSPKMRSNAEGYVLASGPPEPGFKSISRVTQGGSSTGATARLLQIIRRRGGWTIDELIDQSGLDVTEVQHALLLLELDDRIRRRCNEVDPT